MDISGNKKLNKLFQTFKKKLIQKYSPEKIILFGSRARKDNLQESDIDILIVSEKFENIKWPNRLAEVSILWDSTITLEPLCYTPQEFKEKSKQLGIVKQAIKEGIVIN